MEAIDRIERRQTQARKRRICLLGISLVLFVTALAIGLGVGLSERLKSGGDGTDEKLTAQIILPLYNEPSNDSWDPLFDQVNAHPDLHFIVIVNPRNEAEIASALPQSYRTALQKLNDFPNVNLLGYISTNGSMRPIDQVLADSREYATWSDPGASGKFSLDGLYFDDVPLTKDTEGESRYMDLVDWAVKGDDTFGREPIAIHNTKGVPSYFDNTTDITIVFDGTYEEYLDQRETLRKLDDHLRSKLGLFVTSVPSEDLNVTEVVKEMSKIAANLYITESTGDEYGSLGPLWAQFVNAVTKLDA